MFSLCIANPYEAAQDFLNANDLPQNYLDQIAEFVTTNSRGVTLGAETSQNSDPLDGIFCDLLVDGRYIPGVVQAPKPTKPAYEMKMIPMVFIHFNKLRRIFHF